jgi:hypothetical protein
VYWQAGKIIREGIMTEFGNLFDYPQAVSCFECINLAFIAAFGLFVVYTASETKRADTERAPLEPAISA